MSYTPRNESSMTNINTCALVFTHYGLENKPGQIKYQSNTGNLEEVDSQP